MSENDTLGFGGFPPPSGPPQKPPKRHRFRNWVVIPAAIIIGVIVLISIIAGIAGSGSKAPVVLPVTSTGAITFTASPDQAQFTDPAGLACPTSQEDNSGYCPGDDPSPSAPAPSTPAVYQALTAHAWAEIAKDPDSHAGEAYIVYGEVTQFDAATGSSAFRADVGGVRQYPDEVGFVNYPTNTVLDGDAAMLGPVVEKDLFTAKITVVGSLSYDTQIGGSTTVPELQISSITVTGHASS